MRNRGVSPWKPGRSLGGSLWFLIYAIFFCGVISFTEQDVSRMNAYAPAAVIALLLTIGVALLLRFVFRVWDTRRPRN